jgi:hypothetical protein
VKQSLAGPAATPGSIIDTLFALKPESLLHSLNRHIDGSQSFYGRFPQKNCHKSPRNGCLNILNFQPSIYFSPIAAPSPKNYGLCRNTLPGNFAGEPERAVARFYPFVPLSPIMVDCRVLNPLPRCLDMPIRKYLFLGLTVVLIIVFTNLMIRGCRLEKEQAQQTVEKVEEAKPSPTRVIHPVDLKIRLSKMELQPDLSGEKQSAIRRHEVEIYNSGTLPYKGIQLSFAYYGRSGERLGTRTHFIGKSIPAATSLRLTDIVIDNIPAGATNLETAIAFADIESSNPREE